MGFLKFLSDLFTVDDVVVTRRTTSSKDAYKYVPRTRLNNRKWYNSWDDGHYADEDYYHDSADDYAHDNDDFEDDY
jgi:hypothetical protein